MNTRSRPLTLTCPGFLCARTRHTHTYARRVQYPYPSTRLRPGAARRQDKGRCRRDKNSSPSSAFLSLFLLVQARLHTHKSSLPVLCALSLPSISFHIALPPLSLSRSFVSSLAPASFVCIYRLVHTIHEINTPCVQHTTNAFSLSLFLRPPSPPIFPPSRWDVGQHSVSLQYETKYHIASALSPPPPASQRFVVSSPVSRRRRRRRRMEAIAKHDFTATAEDELSFRRSQVLKVGTVRVYCFRWLNDLTTIET